VDLAAELTENKVGTEATGNGDTEPDSVPVDLAA
jgi:hypothetical protein